MKKFQATIKTNVRTRTALTVVATVIVLAAIVVVTTALSAPFPGGLASTKPEDGGTNGNTNTNTNSNSNSNSNSNTNTNSGGGGSGYGGVCVFVNGAAVKDVYYSFIATQDICFKPDLVAQLSGVNCQGLECRGIVFCPLNHPITITDVQENNAICDRDNLVLSPYMKKVLADRDGLNSDINQGRPLTRENIRRVAAFYAAEDLGLACGVYFSTESRGTNETDIIEANGISGRFGFVRRLNMTRNRLRVFDSQTRTCSGPWPSGCEITNSYRSGDSAESNHGSGRAADICCELPPNTPANTYNKCNNPRVNETIVKLLGEGFNIIRECTGHERNDCKNDTDGCLGGLVHIDTRPRDSFPNNSMTQCNCTSKGYDISHCNL